MSKTYTLGAVSAYGLAVAAGYVGTETEWLASLHGSQGIGVKSITFNADGTISVTVHDPSTNTDSVTQAGNALTADLLTTMTDYKLSAEISASNSAASATQASDSAVAASISETNAAKSAAIAGDAASICQAISPLPKGYFPSSDDLTAAYPTGSNGSWAVVGSTDTIWIWDGDTSAWVDSSKHIDLNDYYTKDQTDTMLDMKADVDDLTAEASTARAAEKANSAGIVAESTRAQAAESALAEIVTAPTAEVVQLSASEFLTSNYIYLVKQNGVVIMNFQGLLKNTIPNGADTTLTGALSIKKASRMYYGTLKIWGGPSLVIYLTADNRLCVANYDGTNIAAGTYVLGQITYFEG